MPAFRDEMERDSMVNLSPYPFRLTFLFNQKISLVKGLRNFQVIFVKKIDSTVFYLGLALKLRSHHKIGALICQNILNKKFTENSAMGMQTQVLSRWQDLCILHQFQNSILIPSKTYEF